MAKVIAIGQPSNDSERITIAHLRDRLPDSYIILHNFEIKQGTEIFEIDLAVLAPHCLYLIDVKGTRGVIEVYGSKWYPDGREPYHSPLAKLRQHAKVTKALICEAHPATMELRRVHVHAAILMTSDDARVIDPHGLDGGDVIYLRNCLSYLQDMAFVPERHSTDIRPLHSLIRSALLGKAKKSQLKPLLYGQWEVEEKLGGTDRYTEYRAKHRLLGAKGASARLRVYRIDPYQEQSAREVQRKLIGNAYRAIAHMPGHPNILLVRDFFPTNNEEQFVLVTEDVAGAALRQHIKKPDLALTFDQKISVMRGVLRAIEHAHKYQVIHRNLTPDAILIGADAQPRIAAFDYARTGSNRSSTIAGDIVDDIEASYQSPECYLDPSMASVASDLFSAGLIFYEMLTGDKPFKSPEEMFDHSALFPIKPSEQQADLPSELDEWLQKLCAFEVEGRYSSATQALQELERLIAPTAESVITGDEQVGASKIALPDYKDLPKDHLLDGRFIVQEKLGVGGFAVAYKVFDTLGNVVQVMKIITNDRISERERLRKEYVTLLCLRDYPHPNVVRVIWAGEFADRTPYIIFDYLEGSTVEKWIETKSLSMEDAVKIAKEAAAGLAHLHAHGVYHQDVKPSNLIWTNQGIKIIDFNVAATGADEEGGGGGTRRYLPPDFRIGEDLSIADKTDRDLYALGLTFYECVTGRYPFDKAKPPPKQAPLDPREIAGCEELSAELVRVMLQMVAPTRAERFANTEQLLAAINSITTFKKLITLLPASSESWPVSSAAWVSDKPNFNPFVSHLLTLYSQSQSSNAGTRGLDQIGEATYVSTLLDKALLPAVLNGEFRLVIISGNAGDGKTAFIQQLEKKAVQEQASIERGSNGATFTLRGRQFFSNYDGSQDEGEKINDDVLKEFLGPFAGDDEAMWPDNQTRLIAINEGRLVDFLNSSADRFTRLQEIVNAGLRGGESIAGVTVINLNLRSIVADQAGENSSIFDRLILRLTRQAFWQACLGCDLKDRCYIHHNAQTLMDPVVGPKVIDRLKTLYTITHLRGRLHITLRDLRSASAFILVGTRDCDGVHELYSSTRPEARLNILNGFYFNAWMGGEQGSADRLIALLREIDVGEASNPELDRRLDFLTPGEREMSRFTFSERGNYDDELLLSMFEDLPRGYSKNLTQAVEAHWRYVAMMRRRHYFERRDDNWKEMLPYRSADEFIRLVTEDISLADEGRKLLLAIDRGEGITQPALLDYALALRVRQVERGTIRSYRLFDQRFFSLERRDEAAGVRFIEHLPQSLVLRYRSETGQSSDLTISLDVYEMLTQLNDGYMPSREEQQGLYLRLAVFKNLLAAASYQEVLLTETGHEFYRISRDDKGILTLTRLERRTD